MRKRVLVASQIKRILFQGEKGKKGTLCLDLRIGPFFKTCMLNKKDTKFRQKGLDIGFTLTCTILKNNYGNITGIGSPYKTLQSNTFFLNQV